MNQKRTPEKIFAGGLTTVVCNDGSIWQYNGLGWQRLPDIPQDSSAGSAAEQPYKQITWGDHHWHTGWKG